MGGASTMESVTKTADGVGIVWMESIFNGMIRVGSEMWISFGCQGPFGYDLLDFGRLY